MALVGLVGQTGKVLGGHLLFLLLECLKGRKYVGSHGGFIGLKVGRRVEG